LVRMQPVALRDPLDRVDLLQRLKRNARLETRREASPFLTHSCVSLLSSEYTLATCPKIGEHRKGAQEARCDSRRHVP
ncbi:MAG: hypothetical protein OXF72_12715, partial [Gammaproteobacteria bacterium]|nr:hypothetical protein [Gammaproteobacteria bacterium]